MIIQQKFSHNYLFMQFYKYSIIYFALTILSLAIGQNNCEQEI